MNVFKDLTSGFATFVLAWLVPSTVVSAVVVFVLLPVWIPDYEAQTGSSLFGRFLSSGPVATTAGFALLVVIVALTSSLASRALYRLLEGYTLPNIIARPMLRRQYRQLRRLRSQSSDRRLGHTRIAMAQELLANYPSQQSLILPTRLGNALRALEKYGTEHYRLDSQTMYYELCAVAPQQSVRDLEEARAPVDFFVSFTGLLSLLALASFATGVSHSDLLSLSVSAVSIVLARVAYLVAVQNMTDWRYAMQSMVNIGRAPLARALGYELPKTILGERALWSAWRAFHHRGDIEIIQGFDSLRQSGAAK